MRERLAGMLPQPGRVRASRLPAVPSTGDAGGAKPPLAELSAASRRSTERTGGGGACRSRPPGAPTVIPPVRVGGRHPDGEPPEWAAQLQALVPPRAAIAWPWSTSWRDGGHRLGRDAGRPRTARAAWDAARAQSDALTMGDQSRRCRVGDRVAAAIPSLSSARTALGRLRHCAAGRRALSACATPVMIVAIARSEVHQRFPRLCNAQRRSLRSPASRRAPASAVKSALGETCTRRAAGPRRRADGNARSWRADPAEAARGAVRGNAGCRPRVGIMPALDALPAEARRTCARQLSAASSGAGGVAALLGPCRGAWRRPSARRAGRWRARRAEPGAPFRPRAEYAFRHDLVCDAAYAMSRPDRTLASPR